jgi:hypothetical protein
LCFYEIGGRTTERIVHRLWVILQRNANWVSHLIAVLAEQLTATLFEEFQKLRSYELRLLFHNEVPRVFDSYEMKILNLCREGTFHAVITGCPEGQKRNLNFAIGSRIADPFHFEVQEEASVDCVDAPLS